MKFRRMKNVGQEEFDALLFQPCDLFVPDLRASRSCYYLHMNSGSVSEKSPAS
ncbi:uncharacterized, partial [Tachysurus ichikawai]